MDYSPIIEKKKTRFDELEALMSAPNFYDDNRKAGLLLREHGQLAGLMKHWSEFQQVTQQIADNQELARSDDKEMAALASEELPELQKRLTELEAAVQL